MQYGGEKGVIFQFFKGEIALDQNGSVALDRISSDALDQHEVQHLINAFFQEFT